MDIDLLSKMVKELILDKDEVYLPGIGSFVAELMPSTFSDKGYTINPPYRRLYFRQRQDDADTTLVDFYAVSNNIDKDSATHILTEFLHEMKDILQQKKIITFPQLGRLRATKENNFFFVPDEDLDIFPAGFGLEPVSLKTHQETEEEVSAALSNLKSIIDEPAKAVYSAEEKAQQEVQPIAAEAVQQEVHTAASEEACTELPAVKEEAEPVETEEAANDNIVISEDAENLPECNEEEKEQIITPASRLIMTEEQQSKAEELLPAVPAAPTEEDPAQQAEAQPAQAEEAPIQQPKLQQAEKEPAKKKKGFWAGLLKTIIWIAIIAVILLTIFIIVARTNPALVDQFLYSQEELEILYMK